MVKAQQVWMPESPVGAILLCSANWNTVSGFSMAIVKRIQAADRQSGTIKEEWLLL